LRNERHSTLQKGMLHTAAKIFSDFARPFESRGARVRASHFTRRRGDAGAPEARGLGAAATPLARRPRAVSHRAGAPLDGVAEAAAVTVPVARRPAARVAARTKRASAGAPRASARAGVDSPATPPR
jgi:hypothetical protein